ncbi:MAG: thioredoxin-like domain-containing protein [Spirochaetota bacterium]
MIHHRILPYAACIVLFLVSTPVVPEDEKKDNHSLFLFTVGDTLVNPENEKRDISYIAQQRYLLVYFSASWCAPCRKFTPLLVKFYKAKKTNHNFEVVLVSSDANEGAMLDYMKTDAMPWLAVRFSEDGARNTLKQKYGGTGIPCLVLLNENDEVVSDSYVNGKYVGPLKVLNDLNAALKR